MSHLTQQVTLETNLPRQSTVLVLFLNQKQIQTKFTHATSKLSFDLY